MRRLAFAVLALASLAACGDEFDPASEVDKLRVLGVRAEPPEIATAAIGAAAGVPDRATFSALVADPAQLALAGRGASVVYFSCTGNPLQPYGGACTSFDELRDVPALVRTARPPSCDPAASGLGEVNAVTFSGLEGCVHGAPCAPPTAGGSALPAPGYVVPPDLRLDLLPAGMPQRVVGMEVMVLAVAIAASPAELLGDGDACAATAAVPARLAELLESREHVVAVKRLVLRGPEATDEPNLNPTVRGLALDGAELPAEPAEGPALAPKAHAKLSAVLPDGADALHQPFTDYDAFGQPISVTTEEWAFSFFATAGSLDRVHTRSPEETNPYTAPREVPAGGEAVLYLVVRDHRGGADWLTRRVRVE